MDRSRIKIWLRLSIFLNACVLLSCLLRPEGVNTLKTALGVSGDLLLRSRDCAQTGWNTHTKQCGLCEADPKLCEMLHADNVAKTISYGGSNKRLRRVLAKMQRGEPYNVAVIGGSVSGGHGLPTYPQQYAPTNMHRIVFDHLDSLFPSSGEAVMGESGRLKGLNGFINGAQGGMGSPYYSYCWREHIPEDIDLVLLELAINDEPLLKNQESFELLLRGILELPSKPAVISMQLFALMFGSLTFGGDLHLGFSEFYDVPSLSVRNPLLPIILANSTSLGDWFLRTNNNADKDNNLGGFDLRHMGIPGHKLMGDIVNAYIDTQLCEMERYESITGETNIELLYPIEPLPRLRMLQKYDLETVAEPLHPMCMSTNSEKHPLVPMEQTGWRKWNWEKKHYLVADEPGSKISFSFTTSIGKVQLFALHSSEFHLGSVDCWVDDETTRKQRIQGYWDYPFNIGRADTIRDDLKPGKHALHCELSKDTADPGGGHEFRIISVMSI